MDDYIEREALDKALTAAAANDKDKNRRTWAKAICILHDMPAADVAPVVHGRWEAVDRREYDADSCKIICYPKDGIACTHCRYVFKKDALWKKNFCPNCGARMDGGVE